MQRRSPKIALGFAAAVLIAAIAFVETHHQIAFFRLITFCLLFLLLDLVAILLPGRWRDGMLVLCSLAFSLCLLEAFADYKEGRGGLTISAGWSVPRPVVGWGPGFVGVIHARKIDPQTGALIYEASYTIDSHYRRQVLSTETGPSVVFFGDSFTFGDGVDDGDTLPQRFADLYGRRLRTINLGMTGYSPQQFLREVETGDKDKEIGPHPRAFVFLTSPFHAARTACKESWTPLAPRYALENDRIVFKGQCLEGAALYWRQWLENTTAYRRFVAPHFRRLDHADIELYMRILAEAVRKSREKYRVETNVPYIRSYPFYLDGTGFDDDMIIARLKSLDVHVVDMSLREEAAHGAVIAIKGDGHPTVFAHQKRAQILADTVGPLSNAEAGPAALPDDTHAVR